MFALSILLQQTRSSPIDQLFYEVQSLQEEVNDLVNIISQKGPQVSNEFSYLKHKEAEEEFFRRMGMILGNEDEKGWTYRMEPTPTTTSTRTFPESKGLKLARKKVVEFQKKIKEKGIDLHEKVKEIKQKKNDFHPIDLIFPPITVYAAPTKAASRTRGGSNDKAWTYRVDTPSTTPPHLRLTQEQIDRLKDLIEKRGISNGWLSDFVDWLLPSVFVPPATVVVASPKGKGGSYENAIRNGWFGDFVHWLSSNDKNAIRNGWFGDFVHWLSSNDENQKHERIVFQRPSKEEIQELVRYISERGLCNGWFGEFVEWLTSPKNSHLSYEEEMKLIREFISRKGLSNGWLADLLFDILDFLTGPTYEAHAGTTSPPSKGGSGQYFENDESNGFLDWLFKPKDDGELVVQSTFKPSGSGDYTVCENDERNGLFDWLFGSKDDDDKDGDVYLQATFAPSSSRFAVCENGKKKGKKDDGFLIVQSTFKPSGSGYYTVCENEERPYIFEDDSIELIDERNNFFGFLAKQKSPADVAVTTPPPPRGGSGSC